MHSIALRAFTQKLISVCSIGVRAKLCIALVMCLTLPRFYCLNYKNETQARLGL